MKLAAAALTLAALCASFAPTQADSAARLQRAGFVSGGTERTCYFFVPASLAASAPAPVLVLLHGSFSNGSELARKWTALASREGVILVAPASSDGVYWRLKGDGPALIRDAVEEAAARHPIDRRRIYLFGHSGGAVHALTLAMLESEYFAAVAVHAGAWREAANYDALKIARRRIPVALFGGDRDFYFPLESVQRTAEAMRKAGHSVLVKIIPRHDHNYNAVANEVAKDAWNFLRATALDEDARFQPYD